MKPPLPIYLFSKTSHDDVNHIPILETRFLTPAIDFECYDAIVLTSKQALTALEKAGYPWKSLPVLAVAGATAKAAEALGARLLAVGSGYGGDLGALICSDFPRMRWLYPRPVRTASDFAERVRSKGVDLDEKVLYETRCNAAAAISLPDDAVLIFTSPFTIECFMKQYRFLPTHRVIVLGRTTASTLPAGIRASMPDSPSVDEAVALAKKLAV